MTFYTTSNGKRFKTLAGAKKYARKFADTHDYGVEISAVDYTREKKAKKRVSSALKKFLKGQKNPTGKAVRLKNFTGTVLRTPRGQVIIRGRGKR